jgi:hypothetical protein
MLYLKAPTPVAKALRVLDHPIAWLMYVVLAIYILFAGISIMRGIMKYNYVLDEIERSKTVAEASINKQLSDFGFEIKWGDEPKLIDYLCAGMP